MRVLLAIALGLLSITSARAFFFTSHTPTYEYVNDRTGHYVLLTRPEEIALVTAGGAGPGWRRTGFVFNDSFSNTGDPTRPGTALNCRFYNPGANSHFLTVDPIECAALKIPGSGWLYQGDEFRVLLLVGGRCPSGSHEVHRLYNNRWMFNDSNHRYVADDEVRARMVATGWIDEGRVFCHFDARRDSERQFSLAALGESLPFAPCGPGRTCADMRNLPPIQRSLDRHLTDRQVGGTNPDYAPSFDALSGWREWWGRLFTTSSGLDAPSVNSSTFIVVAPADLSAGQDVNPSNLGIHIAPESRGAGVASIALRRELLVIPVAPGLTDERIKPWEGARDSDIVIAVLVRNIALARSASGEGQAYGLLALELHDERSGHGIVVTLQAYGTQPSGDFVGRDARGRVIVSTVFRDSPDFGHALRGRYIRCRDGQCPMQDNSQYTFRITRTSIPTILERARTADASLSDDPGDYRVAAFECRSEVAGDGEVGVTTRSCQLDVTY